MEKIVFISGKRTAFGAFGGGLKDISATDLTVAAGLGTIQAAGVNPADIGQIIIGNVVQSGADAAYLARHAGLKLNVPVTLGVPFNTPVVAFNDKPAGNAPLAKFQVMPIGTAVATKLWL